jgi:hypothetical protein
MDQERYTDLLVCNGKLIFWLLKYQVPLMAKVHSISPCTLEKDFCSDQVPIQRSCMPTRS